MDINYLSMRMLLDCHVVLLQINYFLETKLCLSMYSLHIHENHSGKLIFFALWIERNDKRRHEKFLNYLFVSRLGRRAMHVPHKKV